MAYHLELGKEGERLAEEFLTRQGYRIIERNFKNQLGEIDLIGMDGETICFIEVKTRISDECGSPFESVTYQKQKKIARVALSYLQEKGCLDELARFDVVAVDLQKEKNAQIDVLKNAFDV